MNSRFLKTLVAAAVIVGVACVDMSAPNGPASISLLLLPSPAVVAGDVMRDSTGAPAPLSVVAYDAGGKPIPGLTTQFFLTDSLSVAHLTSANVVVGDKIGTAHIVGQVGSLQTASMAVPVTPTPAKFLRTTTADSLTAPLGADSSASIGTLGLGTVVRSAGDSAVAGWVVRYALLRAPATVASSKSPAVYLAGDNLSPSVSDTTDASGNASRALAVNTFFLADSALKVGAKIDSAIVEATTSYKGVQIGAPIRFVVYIRVTLPF